MRTCNIPPGRHLLRLAGVAILTASTACPAQDKDTRGLLALSLEELLRVEVTSAARRSQKLSETASAAVVLSRDDIERSGATSLPEVLRLVPGVEVGQIKSNTWAVGIRGFNERFANKLLVLVDGRSVYSPLFSGVFWELLDLPLADIERVEVVRGPGAALWGANAVNGVINVITRSAAATLGSQATALAGSAVRGSVEARHGLEAGESGAIRFNGKFTDRAPSETRDASTSNDTARTVSAGLRYDGTPSTDSQLTVQAGMSRSDSGDTVVKARLLPPYAAVEPNDLRLANAFVLGNWRKRLADGAELNLRASVEHGTLEYLGNEERRTTVDLDMQHRSTPFGSDHDVLLGLGYRSSRDHFASLYPLQVAPERATQRTVSAFVNDDVTIVPKMLRLTLGVKAEHHTLTGWAVQPNARLLWTPSPDHSVWAAVSRAVRTPARVESGFSIVSQVFAPGSTENPGPLPLQLAFASGAETRTERLDAVEAGYRGKIANNVTVDLALFNNRYSNLRGGDTGVPQFVPVPLPHLELVAITNFATSRTTKGAELAVEWRPAPDWRLVGSAVNLSSSADPEQLVRRNGNQYGLRVAHDFSPAWKADLQLRRVGPVDALGTPAYTELDLRLGWQPRRDVEVSVAGRNLLHSRHAEWRTDFFNSIAVEIPRSYYAKVRWSF